MAKSDVQGFDLSSKSAAVIGCGGLGCNVAIHLAGAGIGTLILCDFDAVSEANLNRQFLYTPADIGRKKIAVIKERLSDYAPECTVITSEKHIQTKSDIDFIENCDIIVLAVDNISARKTVQDYCFDKKLPFVNGGINGYYGMSYLCIPGRTACLDCAGLTLRDNAKELSVSAAAGVIGAHCACLAQKYLCGDVSGAGKLYIFDDGEITSLTIKHGGECRLCDPKNHER